MAKKNFKKLGGVFGKDSKTVKKVNINRVEVFDSHFDYTGIDKKDVDELEFKGLEIFENYKAMNKSYFEIAKNLFEANEILASYDKTAGKFIEWFEGLGLKKTFVYNSIKRYNLFLLSKNDKVNQLSQKAVEMIGSKKIDDELKEEIINTAGIEKLSNTELKSFISDIISDRSEMVGKSEKIVEAEIVIDNSAYLNKVKSLNKTKKILSEVVNPKQMELLYNEIEKFEKRIHRIID